jgi:uncharacterized protein YggE
MNSKTRWITIFLLIGLMIGFASAGFWDSETPGIQHKNVITVSGHGTVDTYPDEAKIKLAVVTQAEDAKSASDENIKKMDAVLEALYELEIPEDDIVTSGYRVQPRYNWRDDEDKLIGFQVRNSLVIKLKNLDNVTDVIDAALGAGVNEINDVTFTVSEERETELRDQAIADAIKKAKSDAESAAKAMDIKIIGPVEISTTGSMLSPYRMKFDYDYYEEVAMDMEMPVPMPMATGAGPQIQPGDVTISAEVIVVYEFK